ncbi:MAG: nucleotide sugar dehydrogenase [Acidobacteria bacterium]|nr:nucleotide sugar dehydrogenase [Acidobacteriota bacterium]
MPLRFSSENDYEWTIRKVAVVGPGIVGMPMAAMLAHAGIRIGQSDPAKVVVLQRDSPTSGWKVGAINAGKSPIGGIEPDLDRVVAETVRDGVLSASHDYAAAADADVILICVQTDKKGFEPDYGPLMSALDGIASALASSRPAGNVPLIVFESTLAPSTMATIIKDHFARHGLLEGKDVLLGNSPNRVMPGRLVERVMSSDKIVAGLHPLTPKLIHRLYSLIVTGGTLHATNSMTAEVVKTLENAYRDVRIAFAAEIVRWCDAHDVDFFALRESVNTEIAQSDAASSDANAVPSGGVLVPTVGVGGHCLPKDGILLWWRKLESKQDTSRSLILESRTINDESPRETLRLLEGLIGNVTSRKIALMGTAYRFNSEDTRNSPTLTLGKLLLERGAEVVLHDPYVKGDDQNLLRYGLEKYFTQDANAALSGAAAAVFCVGHRVYMGDGLRDMLAMPSAPGAVVDGCNLYRAMDFRGTPIRYTGIGRGQKAPSPALVAFVTESFRIMETGLANELDSLIGFLNDRFASGSFNQVQLSEVRRIAGTCVTGCAIGTPGAVSRVPEHEGFSLRLVRRAAGVPI